MSLISGFFPASGGFVVLVFAESYSDYHTSGNCITRSRFMQGIGVSCKNACWFKKWFNPIVTNNKNWRMQFMNCRDKVCSANLPLLPRKNIYTVHFFFKVYIFFFRKSPCAQWSAINLTHFETWTRYLEDIRHRCWTN